MEVAVPSHCSFRFGIFELDVQSGELRKNGFRVRLPKQPLQILLQLLARPGDVVTRDQLQRQLWPAGTFVDFKAGLNSAIKRLRDVLGESAERPRYVETVGRHGYRFSAAVETPGAEPITSLVVLAFDNFTGDPRQDCVAAAMTDAVTMHLAKISSRRIASRTSASQYRGRATPLPRIARELNVDAVVEGAVARSGQRFRITTRLIHAAADRHLWTHSYERDDGGAGDSDIARTIAEQVETVLRPWTRAALMIQRRLDPKAHEAYLKGRRQLTRQSSTAYVRALGYFYEAVAREPRFALGYAGLSDCYRLLAFLGPWSPRSCMPRAEAFARKSLALDDSVVEAYASLAAIAYRFRHDWAESERQFQRALSIEPKHVEARRMYSVFLLAAGRLGEGIAEAYRVHELDPKASGAAEGWPLLWAGRYDAAIAAFRRACDADATSTDAHLGLGSALALLGDFREGLPVLVTAVTLSRRTPVHLARLGHACAAAGKEADARAILAELRTRARRRYVSPVGMAMMHLGLGDRTGALDRLNEAYEARDFDLVTRNPRLDALDSEPRFRALMQQVRPALVADPWDPRPRAPAPASVL